MIISQVIKPENGTASRGFWLNLVNTVSIRHAFAATDYDGVNTGTPEPRLSLIPFYRLNNMFVIIRAQKSTVITTESIKLY